MNVLPAGDNGLRFSVSRLSPRPRSSLVNLLYQYFRGNHYDLIRSWTRISVLLWQLAVATTDVQRVQDESNEAGDSAQMQRFYHPELDGLRFFAFLGVFIYHAFPWNPGTLERLQAGAPGAWFASLLAAGEWGVDLFFVLSSYLITELLLREYDRSGKIDLKAFYIRRTLRIWPLYYSFIIIALLAEPYLFGRRLLTDQFLYPYLFFLGNWAMAASFTLRSSVVILWTVSIEEQFYLTWPLVLRWLHPKRMMLVAFGLLVVANLTRGYLVWNEVSYSMIHFNTFARLDGIAVGAMLACWLHNRSIPEWSWFTRTILLLIGCLCWLLLVRYLTIGEVLQSVQMFRYPLAAIGSAIIFLATLQPLGKASGLFSTDLFIYLGKISYGLYVTHYMAIGIVEVYLLRSIGRSPRHIVAILALCLTILMAIISYRIIEMPFLQLKKRFASR